MDFSTYKAGEVSPEFGKKIKAIIAAESSFAVFLDEDDVIQWVCASDVRLGEDFGALANHISSWESICNRLFSRDEAYDYKSLLAEGYARMLSDRNTAVARAIVDQTAVRITRHGKDILRQRYLLASLVGTAAVACVLLLMLVGRGVFQSLFTVGGFQVLLASLFGGIGAFVSTVLRANTYDAEIFSTPRIHEIDGVLRIVYGVIAGGVVALGIKANLIFGIINDTPVTAYVLAFLAAVSGGSEMIVPSIIRRFEKEVREEEGDTEATSGRAVS